MDSLVSVVVPVYNASEHILGCIHSVLSQTYQQIEVIAIDDMSTDSSFSLLQSIRDERLVVLRNEKNSGVAYTRNKGIELSKGKYIAFLDADDVWGLDKLRIQVDLMRETDAEFSCTAYEKVNRKGEVLCTIQVPEWIDKDIILKGNVVGCSTVVCQASLFEKARFGSYELSEDFVLWYELLGRVDRFLGISTPLVKYLVSDNSRSSDKIKVVRYQWYIFRVVFKLSLSKSLYYYLLYLIKGFRRFKGF